jgi:hypothetical protein
LVKIHPVAIAQRCNVGITTQKSFGTVAGRL